MKDAMNLIEEKLAPKLRAAFNTTDVSVFKNFHAVAYFNVHDWLQSTDYQPLDSFDTLLKLCVDAVLFSFECDELEGKNREVYIYDDETDDVCGITDDFAEEVERVFYATLNATDLVAENMPVSEFLVPGMYQVKFWAN